MGSNKLAGSKLSLSIHHFFLEMVSGNVPNYTQISLQIRVGVLRRWADRFSVENQKAVVRFLNVIP